MYDRLLFTAMVLGMAAPAEAVVYRIEATGTVNSLSAFQGATIPVPADSIGVGDAFRLSFSFDTQQAVVSPSFDTDPTINIYNFQPSGFSASIGSYTYDPVFTFPHEVGLQVWNDRVVAGPTDNQSFSFQSRGSHPLPFPTSGGYMLEQLWLFAFDYTTTARASDLLPELASFDSFGTRIFEWSQYDHALQQTVLARGTYTATITAVSEPAALCLVALGVFGVAMRRRGSANSRRPDRSPAAA